jgi:hypothetical protein
MLYLVLRLLRPPPCIYPTALRIRDLISPKTLRPYREEFLTGTGKLKLKRAKKLIVNWRLTMPYEQVLKRGGYALLLRIRLHRGTLIMSIFSWWSNFKSVKYMNDEISELSQV